MKPQSSKAKGRAGQQEVQGEILKTFPHLEPGDVRSTGMGQSGEDLQLSPAARKCLPISAEVKRRKRIGNIYDWYEQAKQDGSYEPVVFCRADRKPWLVVISLEHYLELIKHEYSKGPQETTGSTR